MNNRLPEEFKKFFWDVKFEDLDFNESAYFVAKRLIDRGNVQAWKWLLRNNKLEDIKEVVLTSRDISRKTANFWTKYFGMIPSRAVCLQKPYIQTPFGD